MTVEEIERLRDLRDRMDSQLWDIDQTLTRIRRYRGALDARIKLYEQLELNDAELRTTVPPS